MHFKSTSNICFIIFFSLFCKISASSTTVDHVDGAVGIDSIAYDRDIIFHIRFNNTADKAIGGSTNGFKFYSPDGANWDPIVVNFTGTVTTSMYNTGFFLNTFSNDGEGADTIGIAGYNYPPATGIPVNFDDIVATFTTRISSFYAGKTLCLDTSFYPPGGAWTWSIGGGLGVVTPIWDGPYCYTITDFATSADDITPPTLPDQVLLKQNSPNPFNATTIIKFELPLKMQYSLKIFNSLGQVIESISNIGIAGENIFSWDASNYSSGLYFYQLITELSTQSKQMVLIK